MYFIIAHAGKEWRNKIYLPLIFPVRRSYCMAVLNGLDMLMKPHQEEGEVDARL